MAKRHDSAAPVQTKTGERNPRLSKKQILKAIAEMAQQLDRPPSLAEFVAGTGISKYRVVRDFSRWTLAFRASGVRMRQGHARPTKEELLTDWGALVRQRGEAPTRFRYNESHGKYAVGTFERRFGTWSALPDAFLKFATGKPEWADVVILLERAMRRQNLAEAPHRGNATRTRSRSSTRGKLRGFSEALNPPIAGRTIYGDPVHFRGMRHEPVNEQGVVLLFGMLAEELGYSVESVQTGFPDCEAQRRVAPGAWQRVQIEFELESKNFRAHQHSPRGCDVIVCWRHNWKDCPKQIEVVELSQILRR